MDEDQRENLRRERRRLQEQLRRVRRQDRLQQRNTMLPTTTSAEHHSPSSRSSNQSPIRHAHLQLNPDLSALKLNMDFDSSMKTDEMLFDEAQRDLLMDTSHNLNSASQLFSTSMENINSNSQTGFGQYLSSTSFGDDGQENSEMISPNAQANGADSTGKRKKKSEKDLKWVNITKRKFLFKKKNPFRFLLAQMWCLWCSRPYANESCLSYVWKSRWFWRK